MLLPSAVVLTLSTAACSSRSDEEPPQDGELACTTEATQTLFESRIAPILSDDRPSSCNECHLSGVDLSLFARETPCESMACLQEQDLVDLDHPERSRILSWIERANPVSSLITQEVIDKEHAAFLEWIQHSARCHSTACTNVTCGSDEPRPFCEVAPEPKRGVSPEDMDSGSCSDKALEELFTSTVYAARGRCFPCHFDSQPHATSEAPRWVSTQESCALGSLLTMKNVINSGYVDTERPERSLLLLKPLSESQGGVEHGGHQKFQKNSEDVAYNHFLYWLQRYAECRGPTTDGGVPRDASAD